MVPVVSSMVKGTFSSLMLKDVIPARVLRLALFLQAAPVSSSRIMITVLGNRK
jgi:hypothetical protein